MLYSELEARVRQHLNDEVVPYRYDRESIRSGVNSGLAVAYRVRPDTFFPFYGPTVFGVVQAQSIDPSYEIPFNDIWANALIEYVAGQCELRDDEFTADGRAMQMRTMFIAALSGAG